MDRWIDEMITQDPYMLSVKEMILQIASADSPVLIIGESGTGKEIAARAIHEEGKHCRGPFVVFHCTTQPGSELLPLLKGSASGTLFLRNLEDAADDVQAGLAEQMEHHDAPLPRIIASTRNGHLREELRYLLSVNTLTMRPLRERPQDIPMLAEYYLARFNQILDRRITAFSEEAMSRMTAYDWPGNVRELRSITEGAFNLAEGDIIGLQHLPAEITGAVAPAAERVVQEEAGFSYDESLTYQENMNALERQFLRVQLERFDSKKEIAEHFGMSKQTLNYKLNKLGLKNL